MEAPATGSSPRNVGAPPAEGAPQQAPVAPTPNEGSDQQAAGAETSQQSGQERPDANRGWLQRFLGVGGGPETTVGGEGDDASQAEGSEAGAAAAAKPTNDQPAPKPVAKPADVLKGDPNEQLTLTRADVLRAAQSLKDAQIAEENRRNSDLAQRRATAAQLQELRDLSDPTNGDPLRLAEAVQRLVNNQDSQAAVQERQNEILTHVKDLGQRYDDSLVKPLLAELPPGVADKLEQDAPAELIGLQHRAWLFQEGLKALRTHWTAGALETAKQQLRKSEAFRKEVLAISRGDLPTPELVEAGSPSRKNAQDANTFVRDLLRS